MTNCLIEQQWNSSYVIEKQDKMYETMTKQLGVVVLDDYTGKLKFFVICARRCVSHARRRSSTRCESSMTCSVEGGKTVEVTAGMVT